MDCLPGRGKMMWRFGPSTREMIAVRQKAERASTAGKRPASRFHSPHHTDGLRMVTLRRRLLADAVPTLGLAVVAWFAERMAIGHHPLDPAPRSSSALLVMLVSAVLVAGLGYKKQAGTFVWSLLWTCLALTEAALLAGRSPWLAAGVAGLVAIVTQKLHRWAFYAVAVGLASWSVSLARPSANTEIDVSTAKQAPVLLVTIDTLRSDAGLLQQAKVTPEEGWWVPEFAVAGGPWTPPAMTSLWMGTSVAEHGGGLDIAGRVTQPRFSWDRAIARQWQTHGWTTAAMVSNPHLRAAAGFGAGFDVFLHDDDAREPHLVHHVLDATIARLGGGDTTAGASRDIRVVNVAEHWLAQRRADFTWVHLLEPHEYNKRADSAYAAAVARTAQQLRRLLDAAPQHTIVIIGDHGESLGEEGRLGHGRHLAPEVLKVPVAIRQPGSPGTSTGPVAATDIGAWLQARAQSPDVPLPTPVSTVVPVAGVRHTPLQSGVFDPRTGGVQYVADLAPGPPGSTPTDRERDALHALGYLEP